MFSHDADGLKFEDEYSLNLMFVGERAFLHNMDAATQLSAATFFAWPEVING